jgi:peptide/nickel transport system substrate-binding protein
MWATQSYQGGFNMNKYSNSRVDELCAQGISELDQNKRKQIYVEMQNIIMDELPNMILFFTQSAAAVNKRVHNFKPNAINYRWNSHTWWVEDGK